MQASVKTTRSFLWSSAVILSATGAAKLTAAFGSARILSAMDPFLHLRYRELMIGCALIELAVSVYLIRGRNISLRLLAVLWLGTNFLIYRKASALLHIHVCPCLGTLGDALPLSRNQVNILLELI